MLDTAELYLNYIHFNLKIIASDIPMQLFYKIIFNVS